jgi:Sec-independent protein translocase protein TatA
MGRSLGKGMREFKDSISGKDEVDRPEIAASTASPEDETARPTPERDTVSS